MDINDFLNLSHYDDISLDFSYVSMPLSLFCKKLGINPCELSQKSEGNIKELL